MILLAGVGVAVAWQWCRRPAAKAGLGIALLIAAGHLGWEAMSLARKYSSDRLNPYVYAQTSPDLLELVNRVSELGDVSAEGDDMLIKVMVSEGDYWPLPWYLREFNRTGWWPEIPDDPGAAVVITNPGLASALPEGFKQSHFMAGYFSLRPQVFLELHVETNLWEEFMEKRAGSGR
jgi:predicted membrane-bound mannosyltransferase